MVNVHLVRFSEKLAAALGDAGLATQAKGLVGAAVHGRLVAQACRLDAHVLAGRKGVGNKTGAQLGREGGKSARNAAADEVHRGVNDAGDLGHGLGQVLAHLVDGKLCALVARGQGTEDREGVGRVLDVDGVTPRRSHSAR